MLVNILIVDDNKSNLETLDFLIKDIDFEENIKINVLQADNGNDALSLAIKHKIALIILDIQMPDMDGFEVARYLKKSSKTKDIPIAFLTAIYKSEDMREHGLHLGAFDYFMKPIDHLILVPKIKLYVNFYVVTNELKNTNIELEEKIKEAVDKNSIIEAELYESQKLNSMGEMIENIAHQWRQPLSVISTAATGVKVQNEYGQLSDKDLDKLMDSINNAAQFLSNTINDFSDFIKGDNGESILFNLTEDIDKCLEIEDSNIKQNFINVIKDLDNTIELINLPNGLLQALVHVVNNACHALKFHQNKNDRFIFIKTFAKDKEIIISIKDTGNGIENNILEQIFEPYFTTKHKSQGTGLGLHMTYKIITENMNGTIDIRNKTFNYNNKEYTGVKVIIKLPMS